jgi:DNA primase
MEQRIEALFAHLNADALRFQELYYSERRYLDQLDTHRRAGLAEVLAVPSVQADPPAGDPVASGGVAGSA